MFGASLLNGFRKKLSTQGPGLPEWHVLCMVFRNIDVEYVIASGRRHMRYVMRPDEIEKAEWSFRHFPLLAKECSCGLANVIFDIVHIDRPIHSLSPLDNYTYWVSPSDVHVELDIYAPPGTYDSIFVYWPQNNFYDNLQIPSPGWGLAIGPGHIPGGATYCSIANATSYNWDIPLVGEVWLHEWLHGICDFFQSKGFTMPLSNADGGGSHGYKQSPVTGWCRYYRDLMTGRVKENGRLTGIKPEAWLSGTIRDAYC